MFEKKIVFYLRTDICKGKLIAGGSVAHTLGVIQGLLDQNYDVIAASSIMIDQVMSAVQHCRPLFMPKKIEWLRWKINCFISTFVFFWQCSDFLQKSGPIDYIYQRYTILNFTGVLLSYIKRVPLFLEYNGSEVWVNSFWAEKRFITFRWLIQWVENLNIRSADRIIVVSKPLKNELVQRGIDRNKIVVTPNGVNTVVYNSALLVDDRKMLRNQLGITDSFVFGFIGTFSIWHGIEMLVTMASEVLKQKPHVRFLFIGDGPLFGSLQNQLQGFIQEKKVICTGIIPQHEAKKYLAACDAFLSPTQPNPDGTPFFGSPTKLFEYLSMAKPIIASKLDQVAEVICPALKIDELQDQVFITDQVGIIVEPKNDQGFIRAACWLADLESSQRERLGLNARAKAINEHDWKKHVEKIMRPDNYE